MSGGAYHARLFAPGPTPVPDLVRLSMAGPMIHHRTVAFAAVMQEVRDSLRWLFQTEHEVLILSGTGTVGMEASVCNFLSPGDCALYVAAGRFGERWGELLAAYGCRGVAIEVPWGQAVTADQVAAALARHPEARAVYLQACETSTGVAHPVAAVAALCQAQPQTLCIVDAITALGVDDLALDRDGIDVLISASQKALMLPPGLALVGVAPRAWAAAQRSTLPRYYLDLAREQRAAQKNQTAWTASVSLILGLQASLRLMQGEGLQDVFARHRALAAACRAGLAALGCGLYAQSPARGLTAVTPQPGVAAGALKDRLQKQFNLTLGGGQGALAGKVIRLAHMGYFDALDMATALAAIERALAAEGAAVTFGAGVGALQASFSGPAA